MLISLLFLPPHRLAARKKGKVSRRQRRETDSTSRESKETSLRSGRGRRTEISSRYDYRVQRQTTLQAKRPEDVPDRAFFSRLNARLVNARIFEMALLKVDDCEARAIWSAAVWTSKSGEMRRRGEGDRRCRRRGCDAVARRAGGRSSDTSRPPLPSHPFSVSLALLSNPPLFFLLFPTHSSSSLPPLLLPPSPSPSTSTSLSPTARTLLPFRTRTAWPCSTSGRPSLPSPSRSPLFPPFFRTPPPSSFRSSSLFFALHQILPSSTSAQRSRPHSLSAPSLVLRRPAVPLVWLLFEFLRRGR